MSAEPATWEEETLASLQSALGAEHAALWVYGLASGFATEPRVAAAISAAMQQHRAQRDQAERVLRAAGQQPTLAQPAYSLPHTVTDQASAIRLLIVAEEDCGIGWRSVLESGSDPQLRQSALDGLTSTSVRATRWRLTIGTQPAAQALPGLPR